MASTFSIIKPYVLTHIMKFIITGIVLDAYLGVKLEIIFKFINYYATNIIF